MTLNIHELLSPIFKTLNIDEIILKGKDFEVYMNQVSEISIHDNNLIKLICRKSEKKSIDKFFISILKKKNNDNQ